MCARDQRELPHRTVVIDRPSQGINIALIVDSRLRLMFIFCVTVSQDSASLCGRLPAPRHHRTLMPPAFGPVIDWACSFGVYSPYPLSRFRAFRQGIRHPLFGLSSLSLPAQRRARSHSHGTSLISDGANWACSLCILVLVSCSLVERARKRNVKQTQVPASKDLRPRL